MRTPTVGVLITYFNEGPLLRECLDSVLSQRERPDEILVYDDASDDPADRYLPSSAPVQVLHGTKNVGPGAARNELLQYSRSEFVHFQDADDLFVTHWCESVRSALRTTQRELVLTEISSFLEGRTICERVSGLAHVAAKGDLTRFAIEGGIILSPTSTFRRDVGLEIGGFRTREVLPLSEDFDFHVRLAATGISYAILPTPLISIRLRPDSLSRSNGRTRTECWLSGLNAIRLLSSELPRRYRPPCANAAARFAAQLFREGAYKQAREAFAFARELGPPDLCWQHGWYRTVAQLLGPMTAEYMGESYRAWIPEGIRQRLASLRRQATFLGYRKDYGTSHDKHDSSH